MDADTRTQFKLISEIARLCKRARMRFWLRGGWALDFLIGRVTRSHSDIDLVTWRHHGDRIELTLLAAGYRVATVTDQAAIHFTKADQDISGGVHVQIMKRLLRNERGQIAVLAALLLTVFLGFVGLIVDAGSFYGARRQAQTAGDKAALAAAYELTYGGTVAAATTAALENAAANGFDNNGSSNSVTVNIPPRPESTSAMSTTLRSSSRRTPLPSSSTYWCLEEVSRAEECRAGSQDRTTPSSSVRIAAAT